MTLYIVSKISKEYVYKGTARCLFHFLYDFFQILHYKCSVNIGYSHIPVESVLSYTLSIFWSHCNEHIICWVTLV